MMKPLKNKNLHFTLPTLVLLLPLIVLMSTNIYGQEAGQIDSVPDTESQENVKQDSLGESDSDSLPFPFGGDNQLNFGALIAKAFGYFLLVIALIFGSVYVLRKFVYNKRDFSSKNKTIQILSTTYVGPKKSLLLVEAAGRILVLSATDSQMNLITELEKEEYEDFVQSGLDETKVSSAVGNQFGEILSKFLKRPK